ncbi:MAG: DEAD/DEAH box helicase [Bacteroidales bacterium]
MKFSQYQFCPELQRNIADMGYKRPTDIQFKSITPILQGQDVLAIAQTGTGKTAAFAIPVIQKIHQSKSNKSSKGIRCVVLAPTRELVVQLGNFFNKIEKHTFVKSVFIIGGVEQEPQIKKLVKGCDILIATPGRMFDLYSQGYINFDNVDTLIIDEAEQMLRFGFLDDINQLVKKLPPHQTLFFSATINKEIKRLAYSVVRNPIRIQISPKNPISRNIKHLLLKVKMDDKRFFLERLIKEHQNEKVLVFVRTKVRAERVKKFLDRVGIVSGVIHGSKEQSDRLDVLNDFKEGDLLVLIATDVSSRGIDIPDVAVVVNYDMPESGETYVHRIGRTGRYRQKGFAYSFCDKNEMNQLQNIQDYIGEEIELMPVKSTDYSDTISYSEESSADWKSLTKQIEEFELSKKKKKKK